MVFRTNFASKNVSPTDKLRLSGDFFSGKPNSKRDIIAAQSAYSREHFKEFLKWNKIASTKVESRLNFMEKRNNKAASARKKDVFSNSQNYAGGTLKQKLD